MVIYRYVKKLPAKQACPRENRKKLNPKFLAGMFVVAGILFLINAAYPIISYQLLVSPRFSQSYVSPSSEAAITQSFGAPQDKSFGASKPPVLGTEIDLVDLTRASNWFPEEKTATFSATEISSSSFTLSIPKLKIFDAQVLVGLEDLKKSLIQYPGTAEPGRYGNTVIFGHSVLPQFYNPKNYSSIFSTLPTLKQKDEIFVTHNQVQYKYTVEQMIEVEPNDISILAQRYDDSYMTLITCVPPGTYLRRLIVRARLTKM